MFRTYFRISAAQFEALLFFSQSSFLSFVSRLSNNKTWSLSANNVVVVVVLFVLHNHRDQLMHLWAVQKFGKIGLNLKSNLFASMIFGYIFLAYLDMCTLGSIAFCVRSHVQSAV